MTLNCSFKVRGPRKGDVVGLVLLLGLLILLGVILMSLQYLWEMYWQIILPLGFGAVFLGLPVYFGVQYWWHSTRQQRLYRWALKEDQRRYERARQDLINLYNETMRRFL